MLLSVSLQAQDTLKKSNLYSKEPWVKSLIIRKGIDDKDDKEKPGVFSLTWPQDGKANSYLINAAASLNFSHIIKGRGRIDLTPSFAFNRNNQVKKDQYNMKGLFAADIYLGKIDDVKKTHQLFRIYPTIQYMRDKIDSSTSFFSTAYFTWVVKNPRFQLNNYINFGNSGFLFYVGPAIGIEYQNRFNVKKIDTKGNITRFFFGGDVRLAFKDGKEVPVNAAGIKKRYLGNKLFELTFNYSGRKELSSNLIKKEGFIYLLKTEFSYYPLRTEALSFGLLYNDGEDPIAAILNQKFFQFAIKLKLDYAFKKK